jgi:ABC-2 type transport system permease protein
VDETKISKNNLKAVRMFSSSDKSWEIRKNISLNPLFLPPPPSADQMQQFPLAYMIEGKFPSYFAGKPIPEKTSNEKKSTGEDKKDKKEKTSETANKKTEAELAKIKGQEQVISQGKPSKIFLMASSDMLENNVLDPEGDSPNDMFVLNTLDALNNRDDIAAMRSKVLNFNPLQETGALTKTFVKTFNIAGLPILVVFLGLLIWLRRHSRKKRIQMMFQK